MEGGGRRNENSPNHSPPPYNRLSEREGELFVRRRAACSTFTRFRSSNEEN